jgi:hypothetical protein
MWNADLGADALKHEVLAGVLMRRQADAAGPSCSLFAEVWLFECRRSDVLRHYDTGMLR